MERCTCVIKKAPTYEVYVQTPCGIHRRMVEDAIEKCAQIVEAGAEGIYSPGHQDTISNVLKMAAGKIRESQKN